MKRVEKEKKRRELFKKEAGHHGNQRPCKRGMGGAPGFQVWAGKEGSFSRDVTVEPRRGKEECTMVNVDTGGLHERVQKRALEPCEKGRLMPRCQCCF